MIVACVAIPLLLALAGHWLPYHRATAPACAGLTLAACLGLPWLGEDFGAWLAPDPLGVHGAVLASFAWLAATLVEAELPGAALAGIAGCLNLAMLTTSPELTALAAGAAVAVALLARPQGAALATAASGIGLAVAGLAVLHAAQGEAGLTWATLAGALQQARGAALGAGFVLTLLGLGCVCLLVPLRAMLWGGSLPRGLAILSGPIGAVWLVVALRLRGVLDGNSHAVAPGGLLLGAGLALVLLAVACIRPGRLLPAAVVAMLGSALFGIGLGGAGGTQAGLLHLTIGCLALAAATSGGWPGALGLAALAGVPPLGVFASAYALFASALAQSATLAAAFGALQLALVIAALGPLAAPLPGPTRPIGWASLLLALGAGWALPAGAAAWLLGIAAAAR